MEDLTVVDKNLLAKIGKNEIGDIIKPLTDEIHLFDTYIAGTSYIENKQLFEDLKINEELVLIREENKFDEKAILVNNSKKQKLGYIPEKDNIVFSRLLDAGKLLKGKVKDIEKQGSLYKISIGIYLYDF